MNDIVFFCPNCRQRIEAPPDIAGEVVECPSCSRRIRVPAAKRGAPSRVLSIGAANTRAVAPASPPKEADLVGRTFGKDRIISKIASGGMGSVWLTEHTELKIQRALKTMPEGFGAEPDLVQRFRQEAEVLAKLRHRHIAQIHDFGSEHGIFYFVMEYLPGGSLRSLLQPKGKRLPWRKALNIADEICAGLEYAHSKGIVHRDIKPENILFDEQGHARVADFGLGKILKDVIRTASGSLVVGQSGAGVEVSRRPGTPRPGPPPVVSMGQRPTEQPSPAHMTLQGQVVGTMDYMSPEQRRGVEVTAQSDVYSLGVTLFEMLTGDTPSGMETPRERGAACPQALDRLVKRMLASTAHRFASVSEVRKEIALVVSGRRQKLLAVAGLAATAAVITGTYYFLHRAPPSRKVLEDRARRTYAKHVGTATRAVSEKQWVVATNAYTLAIDAVANLALFDDTDAQLGLEKGRQELNRLNRDEQGRTQSTELVRKARIASSKNEWREAIDLYEEAVALSNSPDAQSGLCKAKEALTREYESRMDSAMRAENGKRWQDALKLYESAMALVEAPDVRTALARVNSEVLKEHASQVDLAAQAEAKGQWESAVAIREAALLLLDDPANRAALDKARSALSQQKDFGRLMADAGAAEKEKNLQGAKASFDAAAKAALAAEDRNLALNDARRVETLLRGAFDTLVQGAQRLEYQQNRQGAVESLQQAMKIAPDEATAAQVKAEIERLTGEIANPPPVVNQTVALSWAYSDKLDKRFPASAQVRDNIGRVLGDLSLVRGEAFGGWGAQGTRTVLVTYTPPGGSEGKKLCEFRLDDPISQTRVGRDQGISVSGRLTGLTKHEASEAGWSIETMTVQLVVSSTPAGASLASLSPVLPTQALGVTNATLAGTTTIVSPGEDGAFTQDPNDDPLQDFTSRLRNAPIDATTLGMVSKAGMEQTNRLSKIRLLTAYCLGQVAAGQDELARKACDSLNRAAVSNVPMAQPYLALLGQVVTQVDCPDCQGTRYTQKPCGTCTGTGQCPVCKGNGKRIMQLGTATELVCMTCKESGRCKACGGKVNLRFLCGTCQGRGKMIDRQRCMDNYRNFCQSGLWAQ